MQLDMTNTFLSMVCIMHKTHVLPYLHVGYMRSLIMMIVSNVKVFSQKACGIMVLT
jgi:hypothetical protein